jgi:hypothetical protein
MRNFLTCGNFVISIPKISAVFRGVDILGQPRIYVHLHSVADPLQLSPEDAAPLYAFLATVEEIESQQLDRQRRLMKLELDRIERDAAQVLWEGASNA